jgi:hypothetical protein
MTTTLPIVFILDWDGTIAGKVDFQSTRFTMVKTMARYGYKVSQPAVPKAFQPGNGLIRPGFAGFVRAMKELYGGNVFFFIYTASDRQWALQEVPWVEKSHGIQFQRPIFTREDCYVDSTGNYRKKLQNVWPRIVRVLNARHGTPYSKGEKEAILNERTVIIDNNAVYTDRSDRLLLCPDYHYMVFEDLLDGFPEQAFQNPSVQQYILHLINEGLVCPHSVSYSHGGSKEGMAVPEAKIDPMTRMTKQFEWYSHKCKGIVQANKKYQNDIFWSYLKKLIQKNHLTTYSRSIIQQLQGAIWKRLRRVSMDPLTLTS